MGLLDGKVAVITGAGSGMAKASTKLFVAEGAKVVAADISGAEKDTAAEVGDGVLPVHCDVTMEADVAALCRLRSTTQRTVDRYQQFLASCRAMLGIRPSECTEEHAKAVDAQVQDAIIQANNDENVFLRKWGSEMFISVACQ